MAKDLGDYLDGDTVEKGERGVCMPKVVEVYWWYPGAVAQGLEVGRVQGVGVQVSARELREVEALLFAM